MVIGDVFVKKMFDMLATIEVKRLKGMGVCDLVRRVEVYRAPRRSDIIE